MMQFLGKAVDKIVMAIVYLLFQLLTVVFQAWKHRSYFVDFFSPVPKASDTVQNCWYLLDCTISAIGDMTAGPTPKAGHEHQDTSVGIANDTKEMVVVIGRTERFKAQKVARLTLAEPLLVGCLW